MSGRPWPLGQFWVTLWGTLLVVAAALCLAVASKSAPVIAIMAESEFVRFTVARPEASVIVLPTATTRFGFDAAGGGAPGTWQVDPVPGAVVTYRRRGARLAVRVAPPTEGARAGVLRGADGSARAFSETLSLTVDIAASDAPVRLPIAGPMEVGTLAGGQAGTGRGPTDLLLRARITTFGRAAFSGRSANGQLYHVGDFELPAGGRLLAGDAAEAAAPWYGLVMADLDSDAMRLEATAESRSLRYEKVGAPQEYEEFGVSLIDAAFSDPSVARVTLIFAVFAAAMQTIASWLSLEKG